MQIQTIQSTYYKHLSNIILVNSVPDIELSESGDECHGHKYATVSQFTYCSTGILRGPQYRAWTRNRLREIITRDYHLFWKYKTRYRVVTSRRIPRSIVHTDGILLRRYITYSTGRARGHCRSRSTTSTGRARGHCRSGQT
jgi:hypothetical protein